MREAELILVEQDSRPRLRMEEWAIPARYRFVYNPGPFNRSWGLNVGGRMARATVLLLLDGDILLDTRAVEAAVEACHHGVSAVNPYSELIDLSASDSDDICAGRRDLTQAQEHRRNRLWTNESICFCGGAFLVDSDFYREIGGQDERFEGWGGEDDAMSVKIDRLAPRAMTLAGARAYHLYHPRRGDEVYGTRAYLNNKALADTYCAMSVDDLKRLGEMQRDRIGDPDKYSCGMKR
jgi:GT2 family glycosyltransferase